MRPTRPALADVAATLRKRFGRPVAPEITDPFEQIVLENCAYLVDDERRLRIFRKVGKQVGLSPRALFAVPFGTLEKAIADGGMRPPMRAEKLKRAAELALDLDEPPADVVRRPFPEARKVLKRFPGVGDPLADTIVLFAGAHPRFGMDSNVLRTLIRLGFGVEGRDYGKTYRSVQEAVEPELATGIRARVELRQLLRRLGQEVCRRSRPLCSDCPLSRICPSSETRRA